MKRFAFSLPELMELREFREKQAEFALAQKTGRVNLLEQELLRIAGERSRVLAQRFSGGAAVTELVAQERYLSRLERDRERTEKDLAMAQLEREEALAAYNGARKEKKVLEELRDAEEGAWRKEYLRREVIDLDDIAQGMPARRSFAGAAGPGAGR